MYDFYYNVLEERYGLKCGLLYTDTDSLLIEVQTEDFYKDMEKTEASMTRATTKKTISCTAKEKWKWWKRWKTNA